RRVFEKTVEIDAHDSSSDIAERAWDCFRSRRRRRRHATPDLVAADDSPAEHRPCTVQWMKSCRLRDRPLGRGEGRSQREQPKAFSSCTRARLILDQLAEHLHAAPDPEYPAARAGACVQGFAQAV